jgi:hypothetical protein
MAMQLLIDAVDRTADIEQRSIRYKSTLSKAPATLSFFIKGNKTIPDMGDSVLFKLDGSNFFTGTITDKAEDIVNGLLVGYSFVCMDGFFELDRKLVVKAYNNTDVGTVMADIISTFTTGFTLNSPATTPTVKTVKFNYEQPSRCIQKLMNAVGWDWYISTENVINIFPPATNTAPYEINDTDGNHIKDSLSRDRNITELKNIVYIRGGEYEDEILEVDAIDKYEANGEDNTFPLVYRYADTEVTVDGVAQTVGVDFLNEFADGFDVLYNFQEKLVRFPDGTLSAGQVVRVFGNAKVPLIVQGIDEDSVLEYGEREGMEINKSINSIEEAEVLAIALLERWKEGASQGKFQTYKTGWLVGQTVTINSTLMGITGDFKVNKVTAKMHDHENFVFTIEYIKSGQTTFTDMLVGLIGRSTENITIADNEVLQKLKSISDAFGLTDEIVSITSTTGPYGYAPVTTKTPAKYGFSTYG